MDIPQTPTERHTRLHIQTYRQTDGHIYSQTNTLTDYIHRQTHIYNRQMFISRQTDTYRRAYLKTYTPTDRHIQAQKPTDRQTHIQTHLQR